VIQTPAVERCVAGRDFPIDLDRAEDPSDYVMTVLIFRRDGHKRVESLTSVRNRYEVPNGRL
jgi:hypothetical protein